MTTGRDDATWQRIETMSLDQFCTEPLWRMLADAEYAARRAHKFAHDDDDGTIESARTLLKLSLARQLYGAAKNSVEEVIGGDSGEHTPAFIYVLTIQADSFAAEAELDSAVAHRILEHLKDQP